MIYKLVLVHIFGRRGWRKLSILYIAAGILSLLLASGLGQFETPSVVPAWRIGTTVLIATQAAVLLVLFAASGTLRSHGTFEQILVYWPLGTRTRWLAFMTPAAILSSLTAVLISVPLGVIATGMGLPLGWYPATLILGGIVSFCGYWALRGRWLFTQQIAAMALIMLEYKSVSFFAGSEQPMRVLVLASWMFGLVLIAWLFATGSNNLAKDVIHERQSRAIRMAVFPRLWFGKKVWRRRGLLVNFATTLAVSSGIALICTTHPEYTVFTGLMSGLLAATMAADIRSAARRNSPAEIAGAKGTAYFLLNHLSIASIVAIAATLPLVLLSPAEASTYARLCVGISTGFFAGTLLVPAPGDIAAQCVATLLCICLLLIPDHVALFDQSTSFIYILGQITTALVLLLASAGIEYKRNNYRWRYYAT
jgi:hypothetical protein